MIVAVGLGFLAGVLLTDAAFYLVHHDPPEERPVYVSDTVLELLIGGLDAMPFAEIVKVADELRAGL